MHASEDAFAQLATASRAERREVFDAGEAPDATALTGYEYRGVNTAWIAPLLRIRKFVKAFFATDGRAYGCNSPAEQNGLEEEWLLKPSEDAPRRFGFYLLEPPAQRRHPHALLLDYGRAGNGFFDPARLLRDYLVRVSPGSDELILGKAYLALGPLHVPVSYFVLERRRPLPDAPQLPGT